MKLRRYRVTWTVHDGANTGYKMSAEVDGYTAKDACTYITWLWKTGKLSYLPHNLKAKWIDRAE